MQAHFLLGPAGSGKTFRCLAQIRRAARENPAGPPLLLLAPKQATFQLERQLLIEAGGAGLPGYTRLQVLSFDRLAHEIIEQLAPASDWLDDEGRVMVLRALLAEKRDALKIFHASSRLPGFAGRLSTLLRELQRNQIAPDHLLALAKKIPGPPQLRDKLSDFALLLRGYLDWLKARNLRDADTLLDHATSVLRASAGAPAAGFHLAGMWLDGFSEMTGQELDLLAALTQRCNQATLAFCLETEPQSEPSWMSTWSVTAQTYMRCRQLLTNLPNVSVTTEILPRDAQKSRFTASPALARLEKNWAQLPSSTPAEPAAALPESADLRMLCCANPEAEAVLAAREIRRFVRAGGRFREVAVIVRSLDDYAPTLRRVFARYEIPYFLDRREPMTHHPLAELTRYALRTAAFNWRQPDWFGALKTGLAAAAESEIDELENLALEQGWSGDVWKKALIVPLAPAATQKAEKLRQKLLPPFVALADQTAQPLPGQKLAAALREFWSTLEVEKTLEAWTQATLRAVPLRPPNHVPQITFHSPAIHTTVLEQSHLWLDNVELAFPDRALPLREWLPILEAGLATLTVGVVPPALDQVLIGAIDRSRNPELQLALVLGLNEGVFPAPLVENPLLNELERDALSLHGSRLGLSRQHRVGHEWFYGYIAATRASRKVVLTCAQFDASGNKLNRSPFFDRLEKIFPDRTLENWQLPAGFGEVEHLTELVVPSIRLQAGQGLPPEAGLFALPGLPDVLQKARAMTTTDAEAPLTPALVEKLYGREFSTSVSALEDFAACPFKFFVARGLRAQERKEFDLDARERGTFQHDVLEAFHRELQAEQLRWRDLSPDAARERVRRIGKKVLPEFRNKLFTIDAARRFAGEMLLDSLETLIAVLVGWARDYQFDPAVVEAGFGLKDTAWPAWRLDLDDKRALLLRGRIDRVDVWRDPASDAALAVVLDYKSSSRTPDRVKLHHGLQLQLPAYLAVLEQLPEVRATLGASVLTPAGVFYVNLRGEFGSTKSRGDVLGDLAATVREGFQHAGRYDQNFLPKLDPHRTGEQFKTHARSYDRMATDAFRDLLKRTVENLRRYGADVFSGTLAPNPYRKGTETACDFCDYAAICRFDPWVRPFRALSLPEEKAPE